MINFAISVNEDLFNENRLAFQQKMLEEVVSFNPSSRSMKEWKLFLEDKMSVGDECEFSEGFAAGLSQDNKKKVYSELYALREKFLRKRK